MPRFYKSLYLKPPHKQKISKMIIKYIVPTIVTYTLGVIPGYIIEQPLWAMQRMQLYHSLGRG